MRLWRSTRSVIPALVLGIVVAACQILGVSADQAARIAVENVAEIEHWRVERVGFVRMAHESELADGVDVAPAGDVWLVPLFGRFPVACDLSCDLVGDSVRVFVDATSGDVLGRHVMNAR